MNCATKHRAVNRMAPRPFSERPRGLFFSVDSPSGAGKSTIVRHLAQILIGEARDVHITAEPSEGPIGLLCHECVHVLFWSSDSTRLIPQVSSLSK